MINTYGYFVCPLGKLIITGLIYPILCVNFNDCIETQHNFQFFIQAPFFFFMNAGFVLTIVLAFIILACLAINALAICFHAIFMVFFGFYCCPVIFCSSIVSQKKGFCYHLNAFVIFAYVVWGLFILAYGAACLVVISCAYEAKQFPYTIAFILRWVLFQFFEKISFDPFSLAKNLVAP